MKSRQVSTLVHLGRIIQKIPLSLLRFLEWPFIALTKSSEKGNQAIFILALPRSGSTLTYQVVCHGLSVNFLSNLWHLMYQLPLFGGWMASNLARGHKSNFRSEHGFVSGLDGPAEGIRFWSYWLDCGLSDRNCHTISHAKILKRSKYLQRVLSVLAKNGSPFATAYLGHTLMPDELDHAFPGSILIRVRRDPIANALSLLEALRQSDSDWFSVKPKECENSVYLSDHEKVAAQVYWLNQRLNDANCSQRMLNVHYESICLKPKQNLEKIQIWCQANGVPIEKKFELSETLNPKPTPLPFDPDVIKIRSALDNLEAQYGKL